jgi:hypothetical protein
MISYSNTDSINYKIFLNEYIEFVDKFLTDSELSPLIMVAGTAVPLVTALSGSTPGQGCLPLTNSLVSPFH